MSGETEMVDVVVILSADGAPDQTLARIEALGLRIQSTKQAEGEVEGVIPADRLADLRKVPGVAYVRVVFAYEDEQPETEDDAA
jgi:hypothetical protein